MSRFSRDFETRSGLPPSAVDFVDDVLSELSPELGPIMAAWPQVTGAALARHAMPTSLRDGVLRVRCSSSAWTCEVQNLAPQLLRALRRHLGPASPTSLSCHTGSMPQPQGEVGVPWRR